MHKYKMVSKLIIDVISSKISVQEALASFPKDNSDVNLKCAFDALMHYEADEDIRKKYADYSELQDEYLEYISSVLAQGQTIPSNIVSRYYNYHQDNMNFGKEKGFKGFINYIKRVINF